MSDLLPIAADPSIIDIAADPGQFVVLACERAKQWLAQAIEHGEIDQIIELKSQAEAIRVYTIQKQIGHDAELSAAEIVRRAERGIGLAIRRGQEAGELKKNGEHPYKGNQHEGPGRGSLLDEKRSTSEFFSGGQEQSDTYAVTDGVSDEEFDEAIDTAKAEDNLSRANVVRKVTGRPSPMKSREGVQARRRELEELAAAGHNTAQIADQLGITEKSVRKIARKNGIDVPADKSMAGSRRIDSMRVMEATALSAENVTAGVDLINYEDLDPTRLDEWVSSLDRAIKSLTTLKRRLMKELTHG